MKEELSREEYVALEILKVMLSSANEFHGTAESMAERSVELAKIILGKASIE